MRVSVARIWVRVRRVMRTKDWENISSDFVNGVRDRSLGVVHGWDWFGGRVWFIASQYGDLPMFVSVMPRGVRTRTGTIGRLEVWCASATISSSAGGTPSRNGPLIELPLNFTLLSQRYQHPLRNIVSIVGAYLGLSIRSSQVNRCESDGHMCVPYNMTS